MVGSVGRSEIWISRSNLWPIEMVGLPCPRHLAQHSGNTGADRRISESIRMSHLFTGVNHNVTNFNETQMGEIFGQSIFNVKAYGASGVGQQDDVTAIQYALDAAQAVAGIVYFPPGRYRYSSTLNITGKVHLLGGGIPRRWTGVTFAPQLTENSGVILEYTG